jgi:molybdopterin-guanine dinucleotide biosynthesis protein A
LKLSHIEGAVLAGGASSRMGRDKATALWQGEPMAERVARALGACVDRVRIVLRPDARNPTSLERIDDRSDARAPLVGLQAALRACESTATAVAACDLPELDPRVVLALCALVPTRGGSDVVAAEGERGPEPLLAVYRPRILPEVERRLAQGELRLRGLLEAVDTSVVPIATLRALDPGLRSLRNVNAPGDLASAAATGAGRSARG